MEVSRIFAPKILKHQLLLVLVDSPKILHFKES
nr:MAG TPA: hypothetical protein [Caudoviricetes sp.]